MKTKFSKLLFLMLAIAFIFPSSTFAYWRDREDTIDPEKEGYSITLESNEFNIVTDTKLEVIIEPSDNLKISNIDGYNFTYGKEGDKWFLYPNSIYLDRERDNQIKIEFEKNNDPNQYFTKVFEITYTNPYNVKFYPEYSLSGEETQVIGILDRFSNNVNDLYLTELSPPRNVNITSGRRSRFGSIIVHSNVPSNSYSLEYRLEFLTDSNKYFTDTFDYEVRDEITSTRTFLCAFIDFDESKYIEVKEGEQLEEIDSINPYPNNDYEFEGWYIFDEQLKDTNIKYNFDDPVSSNVILYPKYKYIARPIDPDPEYPIPDPEYPIPEDNDFDPLIDKILDSKKFNDFIDKKLNEKISNDLVTQKQLSELKAEILETIKKSSTTETVYVESEIELELDKILSEFSTNIKNELKAEIIKELNKELNNSNLSNKLRITKPYIQGYDDFTFRPNNSITRAEVAEIIANILVDNNLDKKNTNILFSDVKNSDWFYDSVSMVTRNNIFNGYPEGNFLPSNKMTRSELITVAARLAGLDPAKGNSLNLPNNHWAIEYVQSAKEANWLGLYSTMSDNYGGDITRGEVVYIMNRALNNIPNENYIKNNINDLDDFIDISPNDKFYYEIINAANFIK